MTGAAGGCYKGGSEVLELPLYEYECPTCGTFELVRKFSDVPLETCPTCARPVEKLASAPAIQFKGTGWYVTDYARKSSGVEGGKEATDKAKDKAGARRARRSPRPPRTPPPPRGRRRSRKAPRPRRSPRPPGRATRSRDVRSCHSEERRLAGRRGIRGPAGPLSRDLGVRLPGARRPTRMGLPGVTMSRPPAPGRAPGLQVQRLAGTRERGRPGPRA